MRVAMAVVVGAACALSSGGREPPVAPPPRAKPTDADWLPKRGSDPGSGNGGVRFADGIANAPTVFPEIGLPEDAKVGSEQYWAAFEKMCPRLFGHLTLKIEATDDTLRKLLKARLHQAAFQFELFYRIRGISSGPGPNYDRHRMCLLDIQATAAELWAGQPKELVPWLEELLVASKEHERRMREHVLVGTVSGGEMVAARCVRLKIEAELWKAKNPK